MAKLGGVWLEAYDLDKSVIYALDADLRITRCNAAWDEFALSNGAPELAGAGVTGVRVMDVVPAVLQEFYATAYDVVRRRQRDWWHLLECPSTTVAQFFHMRIRPFGDGILTINSLLREAPHGTPSARDVEEYVYKDGLARMCAHCRRTQNYHRRSWDWVPMLLLSSQTLVVLELCPICEESHYPKDGAMGRFLL